MLARTLRLGIIAICCALCGCVTQTIREGKDLSTSGVNYAVAVDALLDATTGEVIDFDNRELIKGRISSDPAGALAARDQAISDLLVQIATFRSHTKLLKAYFVNLQALADSTVKDDVGPAVQSLSDSISKLNARLDNGKERLNDEQKKQIGALAGLAASAVQAEKIKRALTRDAPVIGAYLALQQNELQIITGILKDRYDAENALFLAENVVAPYVDLTKPLPSGWSAARKQWLTTRFASQQLDAANVAAEQLRGVWADIVQGKTDIGALGDLISDMNAFVTTVQAYEAAKTKTP